MNEKAAFPDADETTPENSTATSRTDIGDGLKEQSGEPPKQESPIPDTTSEIPNGGLKAWLQVLGSFLLFFNSWGIVNSFGVFQTYYESNLLSSQTPSQISWIGSIPAFLLLLIGNITGPIYDTGHFRALIFSGAFLVTFGMMMTSICTKYWEVVLAQGICVGLGSGCLFIPSVAIVSTYFSTKKSFATGIAASGSSLGGIIYPIVFYKLQPQIGFGWAVRVMGFMMFSTLLVALTVMTPRMRPTKKRALLEPRAFTEPPFLLFSLGIFVGFAGMYVPIFYIYSYATNATSTSENLSFYLLVILNAASIVGRILPNYIADKTGPMNILIPCTLISGILSFVWMGIDSTGGLIVFSILYGFFSGTMVSLPPTTIVSLSPNLGVVGTRTGMSTSCAGLGLLVGTPVAGAILGQSRWNAMQAFAGAIVLGGTAILIGARISKTGFRLMEKA
ncbi:MAG: hypothetical protein M1834_005561 [Cirrosporium novae-zelandiae]|nr:MAG: hypothetical protein M1834_005561 [Cirrosporium novae-zelandiae]